MLLPSITHHTTPTSSNCTPWRPPTSATNAAPLFSAPAVTAVRMPPCTRTQAKNGGTRTWFRAATSPACRSSVSSAARRVPAYPSPNLQHHHLHQLPALTLGRQLPRLPQLHLRLTLPPSLLLRRLPHRPRLRCRRSTDSRLSSCGPRAIYAVLRMRSPRQQPSRRSA